MADSTGSPAFFAVFMTALLVIVAIPTLAVLGLVTMAGLLWHARRAQGRVSRKVVGWFVASAVAATVSACLGVFLVSFSSSGTLVVGGYVCAIVVVAATLLLGAGFARRMARRQQRVEIVYDNASAPSQGQTTGPGSSVG